MIEPKDKAEELIKLAESFVCNNGSCDKWDHAIIAHRISLEILKEIPMYTGNLNPKWAFWNDVTNHISNILK